MDRIRIKGIRCQAHLGVPEEERRQFQEIRVDVELSLSLEAAGHTDDISLTVDYGRVVEQVKETVRNTPCALVEALAQRIASRVLQNPRIDAVQVRIQKHPRSLQGRIAWVEVELNRRH